MHSDQKLLITGATGGIGLDILHQLKDQHRLNGVSVYVRDTKKNRKLLSPFLDAITVFWGDILDEEQLAPALKNQDVVFHLAGVIPPAFDENVARSFHINVQGTKNVIDGLEKHNPSAFLLFSSSVVVYGDRLTNPEIRVGDPLDPDQYDQYGVAKIQAEELIQKSTLNWCILRLSAIMGMGNHKVSGIIFHVPLETRMECCSLRDTARAFVHSLDHLDGLRNRIFNLGGGEHFRPTYGEFVGRAFELFGLGKLNFPEHSFATCNFHCGDYMDGDELEDILHFRSDTLDSYFKEFAKTVPSWQRLLTRPFAGIVKWYLSRLSEPLKAYRTKDEAHMLRFFGTKTLN